MVINNQIGPGEDWQTTFDLVLSVYKAASCVVTNSFHLGYWSLLLGLPTLCVPAGSDCIAPRLRTALGGLGANYGALADIQSFTTWAVSGGPVGEPWKRPTAGIWQYFSRIIEEFDFEVEDWLDHL